MKKITGEEFAKLIYKDPSWCLTIKKPLEVITFIDIPKSPITHLSPLLTFSGKNNIGWVADFRNCQNLKIATGTFKGFVYFGESEIEKIENLTVEAAYTNELSASFEGCKNLKIATGTFNKGINFSDSGVEKIENLNVTSSRKVNAIFLNCPIKYVPTEYRTNKFMFDKEVIETSIKKDLREKTIKDTIKQIKKETNNIEI